MSYRDPLGLDCRPIPQPPRDPRGVSLELNIQQSEDYSFNRSGPIAFIQGVGAVAAWFNLVRSGGDWDPKEGLEGAEYQNAQE